MPAYPGYPGKEAVKRASAQHEGSNANDGVEGEVQAAGWGLCFVFPSLL